MSILNVPNVNKTVLVTLNIGMGSGLAWGGYKEAHSKYSPVNNIADMLDLPHRIWRIIEEVKMMVHDKQVVLNDFGLIRSPIEYTVDPDAIKYQVIRHLNAEPTLAVQFIGVSREVIEQVFALAERLQQDCIAVWLHNDVNGGIGQLIGRYNYVWGDFNKEHFCFLEKSH